MPVNVGIGMRIFWLHASLWPHHNENDVRTCYKFIYILGTSVQTASIDILHIRRTPDFNSNVTCHVTCYYHYQKNIYTLTILSYRSIAHPLHHTLVTSFIAFSGLTLDTAGRVTFPVLVQWQTLKHTKILSFTLLDLCKHSITYNLIKYTCSQEMFEHSRLRIDMIFMFRSIFVSFFCLNEDYLLWGCVEEIQALGGLGFLSGRGLRWRAVILSFSTPEDERCWITVSWHWYNYITTICVAYQLISMYW